MNWRSCSHLVAVHQGSLRIEIRPRLRGGNSQGYQAGETKAKTTPYIKTTPIFFNREEGMLQPFQLSFLKPVYFQNPLSSARNFIKNHRPLTLWPNQPLLSLLHASCHTAHAYVKKPFRLHQFRFLQENTQRLLESISPCIQKAN